MSSPFDFTKAIDKGVDIVRTSDNPEVVLKDYNAFIINRAYSRYPDTTLRVNELNFRPNTPTFMQHDYLINTIVPKKRKFVPWAKPDKIKDIDVVQEYYGYNNERAREALLIMTGDDIEAIRAKLYKGGAMK
jgi:hypothetical protein